MSNPTKPESLADRLHAAQREALQMRAEAFVSYSPVVAGERLNPITLGSYNALFAMRNGFVTGDGVGLVDVVNFVWLHHPAFGQFNRAEKRRVSRRVFSALSPAFPAINGAVRVLAQFPGWRRLRWLARPTAEERQTEAIAEIFRLLCEAQSDLPRGDGDGEPIPFAMNAHLLNLFRRELGMTFAETLALPLKQLAQHYREIIHHGSHGKAVMLTPAEAEIWREHLQERPRADAPPVAASDAAR